MTLSKTPRPVPDDRGAPSPTGRTIAVTGKGGTGKTMLAALMVKLLAETGGLKVLAVDADSATSLPYALGAKVGRTVGEMRRDLIESPRARRRMAEEHIGTAMSTILEHGKGFDLLVMGRPESPGCYCAVNDLLRYGIEALSRRYDVTIIDGEAGPEQINRRVIQSIDTLLIVADTSARSLQTARAIMEVARSQPNAAVARTGLLINRFKAGEGSEEELAPQASWEVLGYIPEDNNITHYDAIGRPLFELPAGSPSVVAVGEILRRVM